MYRGALLLTLTLGCGAESREAFVRPSPRPPTAVANPIGIEMFAPYVDQLAASRTNVAGDVATVLDLLADYIGEADPPMKARIELLAHDLDGSSRDGARVRAAIGLSLDVLATNMRLPPDSASRAAYMNARRARSQIMTGRLTDQLVPITQSLRSTANLIAIARHVAQPFPAVVTRQDVGHDAGEFLAHVQRASELVHEVGGIRDGRRAAIAAGDALDAFADAIATAPVALSRERWRSLVREIRYRAGELAVASPGIDSAEHVKAGLYACAEALGALESGRQSELITLAVDATDQVDGLGLFTLQRGSIQEALRVTADALFMASSTRGPAETAHQQPTPPRSA